MPVSRSDWFDAKYSDDTHLRIRVVERLFKTQSNFQKIEVLDSIDFGRVLLLDDIINVTERDEFIYHEMMSHVPLFSHPEPRRVLVVGGGDGGVVREVVKHQPVHDVMLVEIDADVVDVCRSFFPQVSCALSDSRVSIHHQDAADFIKKMQQDSLDVIIIDSTDPGGASEKLFGPAFYEDCFKALTSEGVLTAQSESPFFDADIMLSLYEIARKVFPVVRFYIAFMPSYVSGIWSFLYCSKQTDPLSGFQRARYEQSRLDTRYYSAEIHAASFTLPPFIKQQLPF